MNKAKKNIYSDPRYAGKHVLIAGDSIYATENPDEASKLFDEIVKKHHIVPTVAYVPKGTSSWIHLNDAFRSDSLIIPVCRHYLVA